MTEPAEQIEPDVDESATIVDVLRASRELVEHWRDVADPDQAEQIEYMLAHGGTWQLVVRPEYPLIEIMLVMPPASGLSSVLVTSVAPDRARLS